MIKTIIILYCVVLFLTYIFVRGAMSDRDL